MRIWLLDTVGRLSEQRRSAHRVKSIYLDPVSYRRGTLGFRYFSGTFEEGPLSTIDWRT